MKILNIILILFLIINLIKINYCTRLPNVYNVIGPFPIGEREEIYDTLESYGGIFNIPIGDNTTYPSELGKNGVVGWNVFSSESGGGSFQMQWSSSIDWSFYNMPFGWEIYLWYAYVIGDFTASSPSSNYIANCTDLRTFYIQSLSNPTEITEFSGDFFAYGNGQQIIHLNQGERYRIYFRMLSSTRVYGSAFAQFTCNLIPVQDSITVIETESLIPDIVSGILASSYGSITIINSGENDLTNGVSISLVENSTSDQLFQLTSNIIPLPNLLTNILVGQRFSIPFEITVKQDSDTVLQCPLNLEISIKIDQQSSFTTSIPFNCTEFSNPYLFTFLDFDQTVQYAMLMAPLNNCGTTNELCNIMLATHGFLGVTKDPSWFGQFERQENLWILMPTGRTNCGYDWASSSRLNVFYSINSLASNLPGVPIAQKSLYKTDPSKILFIGHSMGGMGCWNLLVRQGDLALGGACASGFPKLSMYISYETSSGFSYVDQALKSLLMISIEENNVDIISSNLVGLPLMARYGENDTVVNPYHSRRIARLVAEQSQNEEAVIISETPNENHWYPGILSDSYMQAYYNKLASNNQFLPAIPKTITISTLNPSGTGSRANILILQLSIPFRLAKIKLTQVYNSNNQLVWYLDTQNIKRFAITPEPKRQEFPEILIIDGKQQFDNQYLYPEYHFENQQPARTNQKNWTVNSDNTTWLQNEKNPSTYGPIRQIFEKNFKIIYGTASQNNQTIAQAKKAAIYINNFSNNYGRFSASILTDQQYIQQLSILDTSCTENLILIGNSNENFITSKLIYRSDVSFNSDNSFNIGGYLFNGIGTGIAFLMPNKCGENLILVIAGTDSLGLDNALHTIPQRSGDITGPDFIVTGPDFRGKGYGGILSAGYWDNYYHISDSNFYLSEITN